MFVVPEMPSGMPAVITAMSPACTSPCSSATATMCSNSSSVLVFSSSITGITPQERPIWFNTLRSVVPLMIGHAGRNFEIMRAVKPVFDTVMMATAPRSCAVVHVACEMAEVTSFCTGTSHCSNWRT